MSRLLHRRHQDAELAQELDAHLQHEIDDYISQGLSIEEATRGAHLNLGNTTRIREDIWKWNSLNLLEGIVRDFAYAARTLARTPASRSWRLRSWPWALVPTRHCSPWCIRCC